MRIAHISDNHSALIPLPKEDWFDIIVHSGDFLPNVPRDKNHKFPNINEEIKYQNQWLIDNKDRLIEWIGNKKFLFCAGNHDYIDPTILMRSFGIDAINITNVIYTYDDINFYGFPYIPWTGAFWNYECSPNDMIIKLEPVVEYLNNNEIDILVCHAPPYGYLDKARSQQRFGNTALETALRYKVNKLPKLMLCGHIHESHSFADYPSSIAKEKMLISNAATTVHIIPIQLK